MTVSTHEAIALDNGDEDENYLESYANEMDIFKEKGIDLSLSSDKFCYGANYPDAIDSMPKYESGDKTGHRIKSFLPGLYML